MPVPGSAECNGAVLIATVRTDVYTCHPQYTSMYRPGRRAYQYRHRSEVDGRGLAIVGGTDKTSGRGGLLAAAHSGEEAGAHPQGARQAQMVGRPEFYAARLTESGACRYVRLGALLQRRQDSAG